MHFEFHQFEYGRDNYGVLVHDTQSGTTACVDAGDAEATLAALSGTGWKLHQLWITHHHGDHVAGLARVKSETGCEVIGPDHDRKPIEGLDRKVRHGDAFEFGSSRVEVIHTPGHTLDMMNFHIPSASVVFTGDTLFALGCGRLFEGDAAMMWDSLQRLAVLPTDTRIYCGHEYTLANAEFALTIDPENKALKNRYADIKAARNSGLPTIPTSLDLELETNPFLRADDDAIIRALDMPDASPADVFAEIRRRKDRF